MKEQAEKTERVGGFLRAGTAIAFLYEQLQDQKNHSAKEVLKAVEKKFGVSGVGRLRMLQVWGQKKKLWAVTRDEDAGTIRLIKGAKAAVASSASKKKVAPAGKGKSSPKAQASGESPEPVGKGGSLGAALTLVRRLLKDQKDWTRNKLIEGMKKQFHIAPKLAEAAIEAGLKSGKLKEEDDGQVVSA